MTALAFPQARRTAAVTATIALPLLAALLVVANQWLGVAVVICVVVAVALYRERTADLLLTLGILSLTFSGIAVGPLTAPDLFLIPAGFFFFLRNLHRRDVYIAPWALGAATLVVTGGLLPLLFFSTTPPRGGIILVQFAASLVYVPLVVALGTRSFDGLRRLAACYVLSASITSLFGVLHILGISDIASRITGFEGLPYNGGRVEGLSAHPNQLGFACALALPFNVYLCARNRRWVVTMPLLAAGVMISGSRAGFIAFLLASFILVVRRGRFSLPAITKGSAALLVSFALASQLGLDAAMRRLVGAFPAVAQADEQRTEGLTAAIGDVLQYPLTGVGFGSVPHNLYLELLQGAGILGLFGFLWFAKRLLNTAWSLWTEAPVRSAGITMAVWLITGLAQPGLYDRYLYFAPGIILAARGISRTRQEPFAQQPSGSSVGLTRHVSGAA